MPRKSDYLIAIENDCPKYKYLKDKYAKESKEFQRIFTEYGDLIKYWSKMSGLTFKHTYDIYKLYDILTTEKEQNKRLICNALMQQLITPGMKLCHLFCLL